MEQSRLPAVERPKPFGKSLLGSVHRQKPSHHDLLFEIGGDQDAKH
jgi:hypothetical protein